MARVYRIIEWMAQWVLRREFEVDTFDLPESFIPQEINIRKNYQGRLQAPLFYAWKLLELKSKGPLGEFIRSDNSALKNILDVRNRSILAHGYIPIDSDTWSRVDQWFQDNLLPPFFEEAGKAGYTRRISQLPREYI